MQSCTPVGQWIPTLGWHLRKRGGKQKSSDRMYLYVIYETQGSVLVYDSKLDCRSHIAVIMLPDRV